MRAVRWASRAEGAIAQVIVAAPAIASMGLSETVESSRDPYSCCALPGRIELSVVEEALVAVETGYWNQCQLSKPIFTRGPGALPNAIDIIDVLDFPEDFVVDRNIDAVSLDEEAFMSATEDIHHPADPVADLIFASTRRSRPSRGLEVSSPRGPAGCALSVDSVIGRHSGVLVKPGRSPQPCRSA
eukprot:1083594-Amphidinium_carterae.1